MPAPRYTFGVLGSLTSAFAEVFAQSPLRHVRFRRFYLASVGVFLGYTMQATMAAWLMATMTSSALMVALVQTASTAPALLFGLLAGTLSDIVERRRVIIATQILFVVGAVVLGVATLADWIGRGAAVPDIRERRRLHVLQPAQQASINDLVERAEVPQAVALGAVAMNVSRAIGPAFAGCSRRGSALATRSSPAPCASSG